MTGEKESHPFPWSEDAICQPSAENVTPPVWCHEHMEPYCPRHAGQPAEDDVAWYETPGDAAYPEPSAENGLPVEVAAALARVPTCGWHHGQYPDLCWWCGLNQVHIIPPGKGDE